MAKAKTNAQLLAENTELKEQLKSVRGDYDAMNNSREELHKSYDRIDSEYLNLTTEHTQCLQELESLQIEKNALVTAVEISMKEIQDLTSKISSLKAEVSHWEENYYKTTAKLSNLLGTSWFERVFMWKSVKENL